MRPRTTTSDSTTQLASATDEHGDGDAEHEVVHHFVVVAAARPSTPSNEGSAASPQSLRHPARSPFKLSVQVGGVRAGLGPQKRDVACPCTAGTSDDPISSTECHAGVLVVAGSRPRPLGREK